MLSILAISAHQENIISCNLRLGPFFLLFLMLVGLLACLVVRLLEFVLFSHAESISDQRAGFKKWKQWVGSIQVAS